MMATPISLINWSTRSVTVNLSITQSLMRKNNEITPKDDDQDKLSEFGHYAAGDIYLGGYLGVSPDHIMRGGLDGGNGTGQFAVDPEMVPGTSASTSTGLGRRTTSEAMDEYVPTPQELHRYIQGLNVRLMALEQTVFGRMVVTEGGSTPMVRSPSAAHHVPSMRDLDSVCYREFAVHPNPANIDLNRMASQIGPNYPQASRKEIISVIRKWFRKKRDEDGQKVFNACNIILQPMIQEGASVEDIKERLQTSNVLRRRLLECANLCIADEEQAGLFLDQKVSAYFSRRVMN